MAASNVPTIHRADIDGLRAVAVLSVLLFHLNVAGFDGGFIGVDIFFVISGFLITGVIASDVAAGRFSFLKFYSRRARRLLPAMFMTLCLTSVAAYLLMAPQHLENFARSLMAATLGVSNILFWSESGYFDLAARMKPLLHTWSLGVEWQFYLLWPLLLVGLMALFRRRMIWPMLAIGGLSFWLIVAFQDGGAFPGTKAAELLVDGRATVFYNMPFRVFEFACGAVLVWLPKPRTIAVNEALAGAGLVLIIAAILALDGAAREPAFNMLVPTMGAGMLLHADRSRWVGHLLRNPSIVYIGRISYSLYLVHWPIIVFSEYAVLRPLHANESAMVALLALGLASAMFYLVEEPCRAGLRIGASARLAAFGTISAALVSYSMWGGMPWRSPSPVAGAELADTATMEAINGSRGCLDFCEFGNLKSPVKILVVGDSHIDHYTRVLEELGGKEFHFLLAQAGSCYFGADLQSRSRGAVTQHCRVAVDQAGRWLKGGVAAVIQSQRWPGYRNLLERKADGVPVDSPDVANLFPAMLDDIAKQYTDFRGPVILIGHAPNTILICDVRPAYFSLPCPTPSKVEHIAFRAAFSAFVGRHPNFQLVDPVETICPNMKECTATDSAGHILYTDEHHLSIFGARLIVPQILQKLRGDLGTPAAVIGMPTE